MTRAVGVQQGGAVPSEIVVDDLGPDDLAAVASLFADHAGRPADVELLGRWISTAPGAAARADGRLVGYVVAAPFAPDLVELASVLVAPDARSLGTGTRLVARSEQRWAERGGAGCVAVTSSAYAVAGPRTSPIGFWERLGYGPILETETTTVLARTWDAAGPGR